MVGPRGMSLFPEVTIAQSYFFLITGPLGGLTSGTQAVLSYNYGGRAVGRIRQALKVILTFGLILTTGMFLSRWVAPLLPGLYPGCGNSGSGHLGPWVSLPWR